MVQFPRTSQPKHPANRSYEREDEDPDESIRKDLYDVHALAPEHDPARWAPARAHRWSAARR